MPIILLHDINNDLNKKSSLLMKMLDIPVTNGTNAISINDLYNILMDEEKLNKIVSIMKNKAFW